MRVSLPVEPHFKTMSEAATIEYIRHHTDIPPNRFSEVRLPTKMNSSSKFEWMLMERAPGSKLSDQWKDMSWMKKEVLVRKAVSHAAQLFKARFNRLGNLYSTKELQKLSSSDIPNVSLLGAEASTNSTQFCLSKIVSMPFFWGHHVDRNVPRGPFKSSKTGLPHSYSFKSSTSTTKSMMKTTLMRMIPRSISAEHSDSWILSQRSSQTRARPLWFTTTTSMKTTSSWTTTVAWSVS